MNFALSLLQVTTGELPPDLSPIPLILPPIPTAPVLPPLATVMPVAPPTPSAQPQEAVSMVTRLSGQSTPTGPFVCQVRQL